MQEKLEVDETRQFAVVVVVWQAGQVAVIGQAGELAVVGVVAEEAVQLAVAGVDVQETATLAAEQQMIAAVEALVYEKKMEQLTDESTNCCRGICLCDEYATVG